jgi:hypothetical protein
VHYIYVSRGFPELSSDAMPTINREDVCEALTTKECTPCNLEASDQCGETCGVPHRDWQSFYLPDIC